MRANLSGLATFPNELLLEILSYFPPDPVTIGPASTNQIVRRCTLHSLSLVSQNLRQFFRPHLWQRIEVYAGMGVGEQRLIHTNTSSGRTQEQNRRFAKELLRQLNVVTIQDPGLAQCVRIVDVEVCSSRFRAVLIELARCFSLFPNLHTVKILARLSTGDGMAVAKCAFGPSFSYPQIRSAMLSASVYPLLAACPNLESMTALARSRFFPSIKTLMSIQELSCSLCFINRIKEELPSLRKIIIWNESYMFRIRPSVLFNAFPLFPNVRTLVIRKWDSTWADMCKNFFLKLPPRGRQHLKELIISGYDGVEEIIHIS